MLEIMPNFAYYIQLNIHLILQFDYDHIEDVCAIGNKCNIVSEIIIRVCRIW